MDFKDIKNLLQSKQFENNQSQTTIGPIEITHPSLTETTKEDQEIVNEDESKKVQS